MKKFYAFFTATLVLFAAVFLIYWEYVRPTEYMVFIESFGHGVVTVDSKDTTGTDEKYRVICDNGQKLTLNINPERTGSAYYDLSKLLINGVDVTDEVNMLQYKLTADEKLDVLAFFKKGKRPEGYESEESAAKVDRPEIDKYADNRYIGSYAAYDIKDPCIIYDENSEYYYCFGSDNVVIKSRDLINWTSRTTYLPYPEDAPSNALLNFSAFKSVKKWAEEHGYTSELNYSDANEDRTPLAPEIIYRKGVYYLYFSLSKTEAANESAIFCVKTTDLEKTLETKEWEDCGLVISTCGRHAGTEIIEDEESGEKTKHNVKASYDKANAVHPSVISTDNGLFMVYGGYYGRNSLEGGIYVVELSPKTGLLKAESTINSSGDVVSTLHGTNKYQSGVLIARPGRVPALSSNDGSLISGADIVYNKETGYYYLFMTYGVSDSNYNTRVARAKTVEGPYLDFTGADMSDFGKSARNNQYTKGLLLTAGYNFFSSSDGGVSYTDIGRASVGSPSVIKTDGSWFVASQSQLYFKVDTLITTSAAIAQEYGVENIYPYPSLEVRELTWNADGWPIACPEMYSGTKGDSDIGQSSLYGNWDVVVFSGVGDSSNYSAVERNVSQTVSILENAVITESDIEKGRKLNTEGNLTKEGDCYTIVIDSVKYSLYPSAVWDWELEEGTIVLSGIGENGSTLWAKKNFSDTLGIDTDTFYHVLSMCNSDIEAEYTEKLTGISANPSQTDIDAMTSELIDIVLADE